MPFSAIAATVIMLIIRTMMRSKNPNIASWGLKILGFIMLAGLVTLVLAFSGVLGLSQLG